MTLTPAISAALDRASTATITTVLLKKGVRRAWMRGPMPLASAAGKRVVGPAFTLRFVPAREDLATPESWSSPTIDARRHRGDAGGRRRRRRCARAYATPASSATSSRSRMQKRGVAALVTDGVVRDLAGVVGDRPAGLVRGRRRAGLGRGPDLRRLAGADRLRRRGDLPRRRDRRRRRRRGRHPAGDRSRTSPPRPRSRSGSRPGSCGEVEKGAALPGPLSAERRDQGALREGAEIAGFRSRRRFCESRAHCGWVFA